MKKLCYTSKVASIRKSKLINRKVIPKWEPASGLEDFCKPVASIELRIEKFAEFARGKGIEARRLSGPTYIRGLPWLMGAFSIEMDNQEEQSPSNVLACYLLCLNESTHTAWNCHVKSLFRVVSQKDGVYDFIELDSKHVTYSAEDIGFGNDSLVIMDKLLDPEEGFIKDDTVILQVDVTSIIFNETQQDAEERSKVFNDVFGSIDKYQLFSSSTEYSWDFVLIVEGERVYVQKNTLSKGSEYFKEQFAKYKSIKKAVLQNIYYEEFIELLSVIYPASYLITVQNVETVVRLAHIFKVRGILRQCEAVLMMNISKFGGLRTFLMSRWYGMEHLQAKCVDEIKAIGDLKKLKEEPEFTALDFRAKAILLDKIVGSNPVVSSATSHMEPSGEMSKKRVLEISDKLAFSSLVDTDCVLIVEDNRIPIHKLILANSSEYFKTMFFGEFKEKNQDEIVLEEVGYTDMLELLAVVYPCAYRITDKNLDVVLKLADRFIMPAVLERCKSLLMSARKIKRAHKLWLVQRYNFQELQIEYAKEYKNVDDVKKLKSEPEYGLLDDKSRSLIFDNIIA